MPSWLQMAWERGILTTRYPREGARAEEVPVTGRPPVPVSALDHLTEAPARCPTGAITLEAVDQGKCVRCARCLGVGFTLSGPVESSEGRRADLVWAGGLPGAQTNDGLLAELGRSVHVFMVDVGSCMACNLEVLALSNPYYDSQRLGIFFTNSPRHADVLVVVGVPTDEMVEPVRRAYEAMPAPKAVIAVGACPISGGVFAGTGGLKPSLEAVIPVDRFVPGCPPPPVAILHAILATMGRSRTPPGGR